MRSWRYYRNLFLYYATLFLMIASAAQALRRPLYWLATATLWMLHQAVRKAFAFAHPGKRLTLLQPDLDDLKEIRYQSRDGLTLYARFAASRNQGTILLAHGLGSSGENLALLARLLMREGYGILLMDLRAHGNSQGDTSTYGWKEGGDLACMVETLLKRVDVNGGKIGAYGLSLGAQAVLRGALQTDAIRALVLEDLGPSDLSDHGGKPRSLRRWINLPSNWLHYTLYHWMIGGRDQGVLEVIGKVAPRPILFIAGSENDLYFNRLFYEAAGEPRELWAAGAPTHGGALAADPDGYMQRVIGFFDHALQINTGEG